MTDIHLHPAYKEGMRDYAVLGGEYENPYELNSENHNFYERGWFQMHKRPSNEIAEQLCRKLGVNPNERRSKSKKNTTTKEAYLRLKG